MSSIVICDHGLLQSWIALSTRNPIKCDIQSSFEGALKEAKLFLTIDENTQFLMIFEQKCKNTRKKLLKCNKKNE